MQIENRVEGHNRKTVWEAFAADTQSTRNLLPTRKREMVVGRWCGDSREGTVLRCSGTFWWRWDNTGEVVFSQPSLQLPTVLFKIAHISAENPSLLIPGLYLDASSLKPPASSRHSCVPDVFTQKARKPSNTAFLSLVSLELCTFLLLSSTLPLSLGPFLTLHFYVCLSHRFTIVRLRRKESIW